MLNIDYLYDYKLTNGNDIDLEFRFVKIDGDERIEYRTSKSNGNFFISYITTDYKDYKENNIDSIYESHIESLNVEIPNSQNPYVIEDEEFEDEPEWFHEMIERHYERQEYYESMLSENDYSDLEADINKTNRESEYMSYLERIENVDDEREF